MLNSSYHNRVSAQSKLAKPKKSKVPITFEMLKAMGGGSGAFSLTLGFCVVTS